MVSPDLRNRLNSRETIIENSGESSYIGRGVLPPRMTGRERLRTILEKLPDSASLIFTGNFLENNREFRVGFRESGDS